MECHGVYCLSVQISPDPPLRGELNPNIILRNISDIRAHLYKLREEVALAYFERSSTTAHNPVVFYLALWISKGLWWSLLFSLLGIKGHLLKGKLLITALTR